MDATETADLERGIRDISDIASRLGLDPFPIHFEIAPANIMHEMAAYGVPGRFSHWTHGRSYQQSKTMYDYGLTKVYEMVINANPSYAFLLDTNPVLQNKVVAAHVMGHVSLFKHNEYFRFTDRNIVNSVAAHADRIRGYEYEYGNRAVEEFLDAVLAIEAHVDPHSHFRKQPADKPRRQRAPQTAYDDLFYLGAEQRSEIPAVKAKVPETPELDVLLFIAEQARALEDWQRDILRIVRSESLYFSPQVRTKPLNEGFAVWVHSRIMREMDLTSTEYVAFSRMHAAILAHAPQQFNPYALGYAILEDIERRWNEPTQEERERDPGRQPGQGMAKVMEVAALENDVSLVRNYLTADICESQELYTTRQDDKGNLVIVDRDWEKIRDQLVAMLTNYGRPYILVEDGDYKDNGELLLRHQYEGQELDIAYAEQTLKAIHTLWGRPVHIATRLKGAPVVMIFDGVQKRRDGDP